MFSSRQNIVHSRTVTSREMFQIKRAGVSFLKHPRPVVKTIGRHVVDVTADNPHATNKQKDSMTTEALNAYVQNEVQKLADARIKPLVQSINAELENIRANDAKKAALDKNTDECNKRITALQTELGQAQTAVADLQTKLSAATAPAVTQ